MTFAYREGALFCEEVPLTKILKKVGSPVYVYSQKAFLENFGTIRETFSEVDPLICYSVKANSHLTLLSLLHREGACFDVVSGGEIFRTQKIGVPAEKVVYAGVGKTRREIEYALQRGILMFNVESLEEASQIHQVAKELSVQAPIALRLNPDVDPHTHKYITTGKKENKFGLPLLEMEKFLAGDFPHLSLKGIHLHIGSQIQSPAPYVQALEKVLAFLKMQNLPDSFEYINIGGGFGIDYQRVEQGNISTFATAIVPLLKASGYKVLMEPGRFISANAGLLATRVLYVKRGGEKRFLICDSGMHHLIRPTLYQAFHQIWPIQCSSSFTDENIEDLVLSDVVGPICETGDFLGLERQLPEGIRRGDYLAVFSAGAYGAVMASHYNSHSRPVEVLVDGDHFRIITPRETWEEITEREEF